MSEEITSKTIRLKNSTYQKLISYGKYSDSIDQIVNKVLEKAESPNLVQRLE